MASPTSISKAPRCTNHTPMSAVWKCDRCNAYLCRLCTELVAGVDSCAACHKPLRRLTPEELGTAAHAQTSVMRHATPAPGAAPAPVAKPPGMSLSAAPAPARANVGEASVPTLTRAPGGGGGGGAKSGFTGFLPPGVAPARPKPPSAVNMPPAIVAPAAVPPSASAPAESRLGGGEEEQAPAPVLGPRCGPYFCKNHPKVKATRGCKPCMHEYCDACAKMIEGNPRCPGCGGQLNALMPEEQGFPPRTIGKDVHDALTFPFKGSGKIMLVLGGIFYYLSMFGGFKGQMLGLAFIYAYGMKVCRSSGTGRETPPDWPAFQDLGGSISFLLCSLAAHLPAIVFIIVMTHGHPLNFFLQDDYAGESSASEPSDDEEESGEGRYASAGRRRAREILGEGEDGGTVKQAARDEEEQYRKMLEEEHRKWQERRESERQKFIMTMLIPYYVLVLLGSVYLPMALLAVILYRSYSVLNPMFVFGSISRVGSIYVAPLLAAMAGEVINAVPQVMQKVMLVMGDNNMSAFFVLRFVIPLVVAMTFLYVLMVYMRALGVLYYYNQKKLGWFS